MDCVNLACVNTRCSLVFAVPRYVYDHARREPKRSIWCPSCGESFVYRESDADRLQREKTNLEATVAGLQNVRSRLDDEVAALRRTVAYWKGIATRYRKAKR